MSINPPRPGPDYAQTVAEVRQFVADELHRDALDAIAALLDETSVAGARDAVERRLPRAMPLRLRRRRRYDAHLLALSRDSGSRERLWVWPVAG